MPMIKNVYFEKKRCQTSMNIVADDAVDPVLEDETFRAMCLIRKEFRKM